MIAVHSLITPAMAEFIRLRDQWCSTPFCGAPIRHIDHRVPAAEGGATSLANGQGLCEACNYAKQAPGWTTTEQADGRVTTTTPTGHDADTLTRKQPAQPDIHRPDIYPPPARRCVLHKYPHGSRSRPRSQAHATKHR